MDKTNPKPLETNYSQMKHESKLQFVQDKDCCSDIIHVNLLMIVPAKHMDHWHVATRMWEFIRCR